MPGFSETDRLEELQGNKKWWKAFQCHKRFECGPKGQPSVTGMFWEQRTIQLDKERNSSGE